MSPFVRLDVIVECRDRGMLEGSNTYRPGSHHNGRLMLRGVLHDQLLFLGGIHIDHHVVMLHRWAVGRG